MVNDKKQINSSKKILVSICCLAYNHELYIRKCLDGFLMQKTDFSFEILIHDDASTDDTANIIKEYESKYPDIIKPIYQLENQYSKGQREISIKYNFPRAKGKYIAMCEGDDYWTYPDKLQKQINIMENNSEISLVIHNAHELKNGEKFVMISNRSEGLINSTDIVKKKINIPTLSMVFHKSILHNSFNIFPKVRAGDRALEILSINNGEVYYFSDLMGIKNTLETGALAQFKRNGIKSSLENIASNQKLLEILNPSYHPAMMDYIGNLFYGVFLKKPYKLNYIIQGLKYKFLSYLKK